MNLIYKTMMRFMRNFFLFILIFEAFTFKEERNFF